MKAIVFERPRVFGVEHVTTPVPGPRSIAMLRSGRVNTEGLITHRFPLDRFGDALETVRSDPRCLKAVVEL
jgi:threonine dehydrogenase-like Zn-dependent dehydrogenase